MGQMQDSLRRANGRFLCLCPNPLCPQSVHSGPVGAWLIGIPQLVFMTRVDQVCKMIQEDLTMIYQSKKIKEKPVKCYGFSVLPTPYCPMLATPCTIPSTSLCNTSSCHVYVPGTSYLTCGSAADAAVDKEGEGDTDLSITSYKVL
ncbi:hypothetical protein SRHO_G00113950 [Serrasalmus rhombeus]